MARAWTPPQFAAISARGGNLLVSAAAGSGKTAVLVARILSLAEAGVRIDEMLVLTFTRAAAAEMRTRITAALHDAAERGDLALARQTASVERASIGTLHAFCTDLLRRHFQSVPIDPNFRVAEPSELAALKTQALEDALVSCYEAPTPAFSALAARFTPDEISAMASALREFLIARPDPWDWLARAIAALDLDPTSFQRSSAAKTLRERIRLEAQAACDAAMRLAEYAASVPGMERFHAFALLEGELFAQFLKAPFAPVKFGRRPNKHDAIPPEALQRFDLLREEAKDALKRAEALFVRLDKPEARCADLAATRLPLTGLSEAVRAFDANYAKAKEEKNLVDFADLEHFALKALRVPEVADEVRARYQYVFVDEYQDSSRIQEALLDSVRREDNLFLVGDVKQSIYRFRLAEPSLFLQKLRAYLPEVGALNRRIALSANFRAHPVLLAGVNAVFTRVFCGGAMEILYDAASRLLPGRDADWRGARIELHLMLDADEDAQDLSAEERNAVRQEAAVLAERILALRNAPEGGYAFREMAVLMRAMKNRAPLLCELLRARGVPAWTELGEDALAQPEIEAMVALLRVIDNPRQDIPLLSALRGPALGLTDAHLAQIRIACPNGSFHDAAREAAARPTALGEALAAFFQKIERWRKDALALTADALLRQLYEETGHYALVGALPGGDMRQANLRLLAEQAGRHHRAGHGGLSGFLRHLNRVQAQEGLAAQELGERDDVVRVMSIHKSKGLQFPVVFVAGLGTRFGGGSAREALPAHADLGVALPFIDPILRVRRKTILGEAIELQKKMEGVAEEARLLYVAMTRAERRLILLGTPRKTDPPRWDSSLTPAMVASARSPLDWLVPVAMEGERRPVSDPDVIAENTLWRVFGHPKSPFPEIIRRDDEIAALCARLRASPPRAEDAPPVFFRPRAIARRPIKQSVSARLRVTAKPGEEPEIPVPLSALPRRPAFLESRGLTAAERGDAAHLFLRALPIDATDLLSERARMISLGILTEAQAAALPMRRLSAFVRSSLWARMKASDTLRRELPFTLREGEGANRTLLQGIIDCCFLEGGAWVVVDFKSDRAEDLPALLERYAPQLAEYARALERVTKTPVKEKILYLLEKEQGYLV